MAKITIPRVPDFSRILSTPTGQILNDLINYFLEFTEQTLRNLRNGLTFADNVACKIAIYSLQHNVSTIIDAGTKTVMGVIPVRVLSTAYDIDSFNFYYDDNGNARVRVKFTSSPTTAIDVRLVILYG